MFNILVVDSIENELNHLIFLLEDYKAQNNNFDKILNIIDANSEQEAMNILNKEKIHILFISSDMDRVAFQTYKRNRDILIISVSQDKQKLRKWYADQLQKPFRPEIFNLRLRSYIDILIFKRIGINYFEREIIYDLNLVSNLYLFWETYFATKQSNQNEIIQTIYSLALSQIDRGISSKIKVIETNQSMAFQLETDFNNEFIDDLKQIEKVCKFSYGENYIEFFLNSNSIIDEKIEEYEDFALEYLSYDRLDLLNNFLAQHDLIEDENLIEDFKDKISVFEQVSHEEIRSYIKTKKRQSKKSYIFMDKIDLKIFEEFLLKFKTIVYNENYSLSINNIEIFINIFGDLSQILSIYPTAKAITKNLNDLSEQLLSQGGKILENSKETIEHLEKLFVVLQNWHSELSIRTDKSLDLIDHELLNHFEIVKTNLFN
jgi:hypothetical protein